MIARLESLKKIIVFKLAVIYLRYLIGFAFLVASIPKIKGQRFTSIPTTEPVGYFFEALYQSGFYWNFLGWSQAIAAVLLITQRFATLGAAAFLPIILNVCLITWSVNFGTGTPIITTLMLLATLCLLAWDYRKWTILFQRDHHINLNMTQTPEDKFTNDPTWTLAGLIFVVLIIAPSFFHPNHIPQSTLPWLLTLLTTGLTATLTVFHRQQKMRAHQNSL
jgi:hypothetical protein